MSAPDSVDDAIRKGDPPRASRRTEPPRESLDGAIRQGEPPLRVRQAPPEGRRSLTLRRTVVAALAVVALGVGWWLCAYPRGMIVAYADAFRGHDEIKEFGLPPPWAEDYARLLSQRYGVEVNQVAGCCVTQDLEWYVDGYNSVTCARLTAHFGKDIFAECFADAEAAWRMAHPWE
jgi:hypothetical protein